MNALIPARVSRGMVQKMMAKALANREQTVAVT